MLEFEQLTHGGCLALALIWWRIRTHLHIIIIIIGDDIDDTNDEKTIPVF